MIETRYAIYPQQSGVLKIPAQVFSATLVQTPAEGSQAQDANPFGPQPGRSVQVKSAEVPLTVKPKPADYPADVAWLPARSINLEENWSPEPGTTQVGDSLTRTLTLKAEGLAGAQLPPAAHRSTRSAALSGSATTAQPAQRTRPDRHARGTRGPGARPRRRNRTACG